MQHLGHTYIKKISGVYLQFKFNWVPCILPLTPPHVPPTSSSFWIFTMRYMILLSISVALGSHKQRVSVKRLD